MASRFDDAHTRTTTLATTLTTSYPPPSLPLSISFPPTDPSLSSAANNPPILYTTFPYPTSDPLDAKLAPLLVVTQWDVEIVDPSGVLLESTTTIVRPEVTVSDGGGGGGGGEKGVERARRMGWRSWSGGERWGVMVAVIVAVLVLLGVGCWVLCVKFGRDGGGTCKKKRRTAKRTEKMASVFRTGEQGLLKSFKRLGSGRPTRDDDREGTKIPSGGFTYQEAKPPNTRFEMSGGLGDTEVERTAEAALSIPILANQQSTSRGEGYRSTRGPG